MPKLDMRRGYIPVGEPRGFALSCRIAGALMGVLHAVVQGTALLMLYARAYCSLGRAIPMADKCETAFTQAGTNCQEKAYAHG
jgi:hypothetical protein